MVVLAVVNLLRLLFRFLIDLRKQGSAVADPPGTHGASDQLPEPQKG